MIRVSEIYSPVRQGEGALVGVAMPFLRVAACNLSCGWCDSAYTWRDQYEYEALTADQVVERLLPLIDQTADGQPCTWVSITGGEPTLYADLGRVIDALADLRGVRTIVETNGLVYRPWLDSPHVFLSCSPKLPASGQDTPARRRKVAATVARRAADPLRRAATQYKFVIANPDDLAALPAYCESVGIHVGGDDPDRVFVQPDGYIQPLEKYVEALGWLQDNAPTGARVVPQLHRLVHGPDARAV